jgi:RNA polymerase sigma-70 factor (ECF subfamily)
LKKYNTQQASSEFSIAFDLKAVLNEALDRLPEIQKTVVLLRDYEGYNYAEIAEITTLSESQVKVYIFRARQTLKEYIKRLELVV